MSERARAEQSKGSSLHRETSLAKRAIIRLSAAATRRDGWMGVARLTQQLRQNEMRERASEEREREVRSALCADDGFAF